MFLFTTTEVMLEQVNYAAASMNAAGVSHIDAQKILTESRLRHFDATKETKSAQAAILGIHPRTIHKQHAALSSEPPSTAYTWFEVLILNAGSGKIYSLANILGFLSNNGFAIRESQLLTVMKNAVKDGFFDRIRKTSKYRYTGKPLVGNYVTAQSRTQILMSSPEKDGKFLEASLSEEGYEWLRRQLDADGDAYPVFKKLNELDPSNGDLSAAKTRCKNSVIFSAAVMVYSAPPELSAFHSFAAAADALLNYRPFMQHVSFVRPTSACIKSTDISTFKNHVPTLLEWLSTLLGEASKMPPKNGLSKSYQVAFLYGRTN